MTATDELPPCPFCGGQPDFQHFNITPNVRGRIICTCGIELRQGKNDTEDDMRIIWNTRSDYAVQAANERKAAQAIAATVGRGTCWLHDCDGSFSSVNRPVWRCDCGAFMTQYTDATTYHKPRYCPNCGRRLVAE